jgi:hypothetical protein
MPTKADLEHGIADVTHRPRGTRRGTRRGGRRAAAAKVANDRLYDLTNNRYFSSIPLSEIFDVVEQAGFRLDPEEKECFLVGRDGAATWDLYGQPGEALDHMLVLTWHKMDGTGRYEVVVYVS